MTDQRAHSELGASIAARWMACPGSVNLSRGREPGDNIHAQMGRAAHALAEECLREGFDPVEYIGETRDGITVDAAMAEAVEVFVTYCRSLLAPASSPKHYWIEHQFNLAELNPPAPMYGTADFVAYDPESKQLEVVDYKNGSGVVVEALGNKQLRYYGLGAALSLGKGKQIDTVRMTIIQPRAEHPDGPIRSETVSYFELLDFAGELLDAARKTLAPDAPLTPGSHCRFCPASAVCPAQRQMAQAVAQVAFEAMPVDQPPAPTTLPDDVFWDMYRKAHILEDWLRALHTEATHRHERGQGEGTGFKLVATRPTRKWLDEEQTIAWLKEQGLFDEEIYTQKLKSPAQIEKLVGKKSLPGDLWEKVSSGYTLVPDSDKRPALAIAPGDAFQALPPGDE